MAFKFTEEQLNTLDKSFIVNLFLQLQEQNDHLSGEIQELNKKIEVLIEQITLANKNRFGRSSEKMMILHRSVLWKLMEPLFSSTKQKPYLT